MSFRNFVAMAILAALTAAMSAPALAQDMQLCFAASDRVKDGETLADTEKHAGARGLPPRFVRHVEHRAEISIAGSRFRHHRPPETITPAYDTRCPVGCTMIEPRSQSMISSSASLKFSMRTVR